MTHRPWFALLAFGVILGIAFPRHAGAHRLDEYLQATRFSVEVDRIVAEINLTPGADVAENVIATIDRDGNGEVTASEAAAYAEYVVKSLSLEVDGQPRSFALDVYRAALIGGDAPRRRHHPSACQHRHPSVGWPPSPRLFEHPQIRHWRLSG